METPYGKIVNYPPVCILLMVFTGSGVYSMGLFLSIIYGSLLSQSHPYYTIELKTRKGNYRKSKLSSLFPY